MDTGDRFGGMNIADLEYSHGLLGLGASTNDDSYLSRQGRADFQKTTLYAARIQTLPGRWSALLATNAQYAFTELLSPELFSVGGEQFGRGYDPSQILNDSGVAVKLDVRYTRVWSSRRPTMMMPYGFVDFGQVWQHTAVAGIAPTQSVTSSGLGLRLNVGARLSSFVEFGKPLNTRIGQEFSGGAKVYVGLSIQ